MASLIGAMRGLVPAKPTTPSQTRSTSLQKRKPRSDQQKSAEQIGNSSTAIIMTTNTTHPDIAVQGARQETNLSTQLVTVQSSTKIVQTLLLGCVSTVASFRDFFRPDCYDLQFSRFTDPSQDAPGHVPPLIRMTTLTRGACRRVDTLLDLLEHGVSDAIQHNYIKFLQLAIHPDADDRSTLLERWTFTFCSFVNSATGEHHISGIEMSETNSGCRITVPKARDAIIAMIRKVATITHSLPQLPPEKFMTLEIGYNESRPMDYTAAGFNQPVTELSGFPEIDKWNTVMTPVSRMDTGHHGVSLAVAHLCRQDDTIENTIPQDLPFPKNMSRKEGVDKDLASHLRPSTNLPLVPDSQPRSLAELQGHESPNSSSPSLPLGNPIIQVPRSPAIRSTGLNASFPRPSSMDIRTKNQLNNMLQTQGCNSQLEATQPHNLQAISTARPESVAIVFKQSLLDELADKYWFRQLAEKLVTIDAEDVLDQEMLCSFCDRYQHTHCYGYLDPVDAQLPAKHICYKCLFEAGDDGYGEAEDRAVCRRALYLLQNKSFDGHGHFTQALKCSSSTSSRLLKEFRAAKIMAPPNRGGRTPLHLWEREDTKAYIERVYFQPAHGIEAYLEQAGSQRPSPEQAAPITTGHGSRKRSRPNDHNNLTTPVSKRHASKFASIALHLGNFVSP